MPMASAVNNPVLIKSFLFLGELFPESPLKECGFSFSGIVISIIPMKSMPKKNTMVPNKSPMLLSA
ncbi:MAG: hypothetical protein BWX56_01606 [Euryarchaeota archaeon ADurb.Bin023]|nr:MAG: hypothetical protein BWX56_01606 [Euryarchaeota archaeon ADurb.Bin023]